MALKEEHRLGIFENRELRRIFGPKRDEIIGGWKTFRNEGFTTYRPTLRQI
jgi:hypothetical protein